MRGQDFIPIAAAMQARWWAFPIPASALDQYADDLVDLDVGKVAAAVTALAADGRERPPTSGQIRRRVAEMELDAPTWDEVRTSLVRWRLGRPDRRTAIAAWMCPHGLCDGSSMLPVEGKERAVRPCSCRDAYLRSLRGLDTLAPLVVEFVGDRHVGVEELNQMLDRGNTTAEAQIRMRWEQFANRAIESRALAGLAPLNDLPRLVAARAEDRDRDARGDGLRRLDVGNVVAMLERGAA